MRHRDALVEAGKRGKQAGTSAASWLWDGNTTEATWAAFRRIEQGRETVHDEAVRPMAPDWLSGEWAGESVAELLGDLSNEDRTGHDDHMAELSDAFCEAADTAFFDTFGQDVAEHFRQERGIGR